MKGILKLLARMYPAEWRARYGVEYEALLEEGPTRSRDAFDVFQGAVAMRMRSWTFVRITLVSCLAGCVVALAVSFAIQPRYVSRGLILVTSRDGMANGAISAVHDFDDLALGSSIAQASKDALNSDSLQSIIKEQDLYPQERARMAPQAVIDLMRKNIAIRRVYPGPSSSKGIVGGLIFSFNYPDGQVAQKVDNELVSDFLRANIVDRVNASQAGQTLPNMGFVVTGPPDLPQRPIFPKRGLFGVCGLLAGLQCGLILAGILKARHASIASRSS